MLMSLTKYDTTFRKLISKYFEGLFDVLLEIYNKCDIKINNYILIIIFNFVKELNVCDSFGKVIYETLFNHFFKIVIVLYCNPETKLEIKVSSELVNKTINYRKFHLLYTPCI